MVRVEREQRFAIPVEAGFAFITDMANWHQYWPGFIRIEPGSQWSAPGDEARVVVWLLGRKVELRMTPGRFDKNQLVEYESTQRGTPDVHHERHFAPEEGGFLYRIVVEYEPRAGLRGLYDRRPLRRGAERALRETIANLEDALVVVH